ncbi:fungal hydrophobin [Melanogaster broomeanus]|nr:fungal hydrophobin [Melanogaster broomeanus]
MFIRTSSIVLPMVALAAVATAAPDECTNGSISCCNNTYNSADPMLAVITGLLGVVFLDVPGLVGLECTPLVLGTGASCTKPPVCCTGNTFKGLINVGCTPINPAL